MITFRRLSEMAREDGMIAAVACLETGEIFESSEMKNLFNAIKSSRHWEFTCQKYRFPCSGNSDKTLTLCYKVGTASEHYYTVWFSIESGVIVSKGINDITAMAKRISKTATVDW